MKITTNKQKIQTLLKRAVSDVIILNHLGKVLNSDKKLRIKFGIDPTAPDIHLGHTVPLIKLRQFQDLGHKAVLIIGDFTAKIGDPSGREKSRRPLKESEIKKNLKNYLDQAGKIIDIKKTETHFNSEWFNKMKASDFYQLATHMSIQQALKRADFKKRIEAGQDIVSTEMMYPLFQGYDSVMVKADVEIGGEDQLLNLLAGRRIQRSYGMPEQDILTTWLIEGTDGKRKMSKSFGNYIGINERPEIMFAKIMSIPDSLVIKYFKALTNVPESEIRLFESDMIQGNLNPRDLKSKLASEIVKIYYGEVKSRNATEEFKRVFRKHELPENIEEFSISIKPCLIIELLVQTSLASSRSDARRKVLENAVRVDSSIVNDPNKIINVYEGMIVQYGNRNFRRVIKK